MQKFHYVEDVNRTVTWTEFPDSFYYTSKPNAIKIIAQKHVESFIKHYLVNIFGGWILFVASVHSIKLLYSYWFRFYCEWAEWFESLFVPISLRGKVYFLWSTFYKNWQTWTGLHFFFTVIFLFSNAQSLEWNNYANIYTYICLYYTLALTRGESNVHEIMDPQTIFKCIEWVMMVLL